MEFDFDGEHDVDQSVILQHIQLFYVLTRFHIVDE